MRIEGALAPAEDLFKGSYVPDSKLARQLADAAEAIAAATAQEEVTADKVCELAVQLIPACDHASVTLRAKGGFNTLAATSELARQLDASQYELGEGPCLDAAEGGDHLVSEHLEGDTRWLTWAPIAHGLGVRSLMAVPLVQGSTQIGAMSFYSALAGRWDDDDEEIACLYAVHASALLGVSHEITGLKTALSSRHRIGMAQGVLVQKYDLTPSAAFALLHRTSNEQNRKLVDVVDSILQERTG